MFNYGHDSYREKYELEAFDLSPYNNKEKILSAKEYIELYNTNRDSIKSTQVILPKFGDSECGGKIKVILR